MDWFDKARERESSPPQASSLLRETVFPLLPAAAKAVRAFLQAGGLRKTASANPADGLRIVVEDALASCPRVEVAGAVPVENGLGVLVADTETGEAGLLRFSAGEAAFEVVPELHMDPWADAIIMMEEKTASAPSSELVKLAKANDMVRKVVRERHYQAGYVIRDEIWVDPSGNEILMERQAYTPEGHWIGDSKWAYRLTHVRGIHPQLADDSHTVCSIGYCQKERRWYGWSHRAICGFGIGDMMFDPNWPEATDKTPFRRHGDKEITSLDEAKEAAVAFAKHVS